MKAQLLKSGLGITAVAALLVLVLAGTAFAYYSDTARATGTVPLQIVPPTTEVHEEIVGTDKIVSVQNTSDMPTLVRLKVFCDPGNATLSFTQQGSKWLQAESAGNAADEFGWFYYNEVLEPAAVTEDLRVAVAPTENAAGQFDVVIVQQCSAELLFTPEGAPLKGVFAQQEIELTGDPVAQAAPNSGTEE